MYEYINLYQDYCTMYTQMASLKLNMHVLRIEFSASLHLSIYLHTCQRQVINIIVGIWTHTNT